MLKRLTLLIIILVSFVACSRLHHSSTTPTPLPAHMDLNHIPTTFTRIHINGKIDVTLHTSSTHPGVIFHGHPADLYYVQWHMVNRELYIHLDKAYPKQGPIHVDITAPHLAGFSYQGTGTIIGNNLRSQSMDLLIKNNGPTTLNGQLGLRRATFTGAGHINITGIQSDATQLTLSGQVRAQLRGIARITSVRMKGHSWLSLYWVKSHVLKIRLNENVCANLAGVVGFLDAEVKDNARFNGRYLRARRSFVKTQDHAEADIAVIDAQHTLATGNSNIYYYDLPDMKADFMANNGSVLDMREWERPFLRE